MLTGQCKNDFELWMFNYFIENRPDYPSHCIISKFNRKTELEKAAFYVEWFDSVGIYITPVFNFGWFGYNIHSNRLYHTEFIYKTRQEATKAAIEKANELYNERVR